MNAGSVWSYRQTITIEQSYDSNLVLACPLRFLEAPSRLDLLVSGSHQSSKQVEKQKWTTLLPFFKQGDQV